jgi:hypothetical protein
LRELVARARDRLRPPRVDVPRILLQVDSGAR